MSGQLFVAGYMPTLDSDGNPVLGALLYAYLGGTTQPATLYADAGLTQPLTFPVQSNSAGQYPAIFGPTNDQAYSVTITDSLRNQIVGRQGILLTTIQSGTVDPTVLATAVNGAVQTATPGIVSQAAAAAPVQAVNGKTGTFSLAAGDVGAVATINGKSGTAVTLAASDVGAATPATVNNAISSTTINGTALTPGGNINVAGGINQLTGDVTTASGTGQQSATLATVNSAPGTTGAAATVPVITVDAKGRTTSVSTATITPNAIGGAANDLSNVTPLTGRSRLGVASTVNGWGVSGDNLMLQDVFYAVNYGADPTGTNDSTSAIQAALTAAGNASAAIAGSKTRVVLSKGVYKVAGQITPPANVSLVGWGATINLVTSGVVAFRVVNTTRSDLYFSVQGIRFFSTVGANVFRFILCDSIDIYECTFMGVGYIWYGDRTSRVRFTNTSVYGTSSQPAGTITFCSSSTSDYCGEITVHNYTGKNIGNGWSGPPLSFNRCVGLNVDNVDINDCRQGGLVNGLEVRGDCQGWRIINSLVGTAQSNIYVGLDAIATSSTAYPTFGDITGFQGDQPNTAAIFIGHGAYISINGGKFTSSGTTLTAAGVMIGDGTSQSMSDCFDINIANTVSDGFTQGNGYLLAAGVSHVTISGASASDCKNGIGVVSGAGDYLNLCSNRLIRNVTNPFNYGATGTHNKVNNNNGVADIAS